MRSPVGELRTSDEIKRWTALHKTRDPRPLSDYARRIPRPMPEPPDKDKWLKQRVAFLAELAKLFESLRALLDRPETIRSVCRTHSE